MTIKGKIAVAVLVVVMLFAGAAGFVFARYYIAKMVKKDKKGELR